LVVGPTSVPTFSSTPIFPALKMGSSGASSGASAYWRGMPDPSNGMLEGRSTVPVSALC
jgi:hypothetical protein